MTNTNDVQNVINEVMATRGATVSVFGQPHKIGESVEKGYVDIIEILESFKGYEADTTIPAQYEVHYIDNKDYYAIVKPSEDDTVNEIIEDGFEYEEDAEERMYELQEYNTTAVSVEEYLEYMEELGALEEGKGGNSYNWLGKVSNHFNFQTYQHEDGSFYVEFKVHLYGDVRGNYTDSVLLKFDNDYFFYEALTEANGYEEYKGYGIRFSATNEGYEIHHIESDEDMEEQYSWDDAIEYIDSLVEEEEV
ncbi:hypothetical protein CPT_Moonbeam230 [Bacillus phage Moonbeam]|uniref:Uncharacterized protein n=1 Tax=Bacillus phage Moonbeam TaxID=1540091 RepID=A0A0A0RVD1_9CAUD|nr:hypothetical protein CPT_Moonbeam230 [Bacillus phage Moonbeam]AIW03628.1 hypothetical protein CPT_Moonbeam230 [Bacillus phage Moonbeam]